MNENQSIPARHETAPFFPYEPEFKITVPMETIEGDDTAHWRRRREIPWTKDDDTGAAMAPPVGPCPLPLSGGAVEAVPYIGEAITTADGTPWRRVLTLKWDLVPGSTPFLGEGQVMQLGDEDAKLLAVEVDLGGVTIAGETQRGECVALIIGEGGHEGTIGDNIEDGHGESPAEAPDVTPPTGTPATGAA